MVASCSPEHADLRGGLERQVKSLLGDGEVDRTQELRQGPVE